MFFDFSNLRAFGFGVGVLLFIGIFIELRRHRTRRVSPAPVIVFSLVLMAVALNPGFVDAPARFLGFEGIPRGRLLALLLVSALLVWPVAMRNRSKISQLHTDLLATIRQFALLNFRSTYGQSIDAGAIWVVIPVFNEVQNIPSVVRELPAVVGDAPVIVLIVDDGSSDQSSAVATQEGARVARLPLNCGGGVALHVGFELAVSFDARLVVTMDGDGQHDPHQVKDLVEPILSGEADFVIGSRILGVNNSPNRTRAVGIRVFSRLINLLTGTRITDCSSGFRAISLDVLTAVKLIEPQYHTPELIIATVKRNMNLVKVPIQIRPRLSGESKKGANLKYGFMFARSIVRAWLR